MKLTPAQVYRLACDAGFTPGQARIMTAIAGAESGYDTNAVGDVRLQNATWGPSVGLWQCRTLKAHTGRGGPRDIAALGSPAAQARAARAIYQEQGLRAWSTYTNGAYRRHLGEASGGAVAGTTPGGGSGATVLAAGRGWLGTPYQWGGTTRRGVDCSGFTQASYRAAGISLPRVAAAQQRAVVTIPQSAAQPGDLVFWGRPAHHVALYLGGGQVLHAPHPGTVVRVEKIWGSPTFGHHPALSGGPAMPGGFDAAAAGFSLPNPLDGIGAAADQLTGTLSGIWTGVQVVAIKGAVVVLGAGLVIAGAAAGIQASREA